MKQQTVTKTINSDVTGHDTTNYSYYSLSSANNGHTGSNSTTYATVNLKRTSQGETYVYWKFSMPEIPEGASITSVKITAKCRISTASSSYISARYMQPCSGTTLKDSRTNITTSAQEVQLTTSGSWTRQDIANLGVYLYAKRTTSSYSSSIYFRWYGATAEVTYTYQETLYTITSEVHNIGNVTTTPTTQDVTQGGNAEVIFSDKPSKAVLTDNGVDKTSELTLPSSGSASSFPTHATAGSTIHGTNYTYCIGKGHTAASSSGNDYTNQGEGDIIYDFSFNIPENVVIQSVSIIVKGHCENASGAGHKARVQPMSGTTAMGSYQNFTSTTDSLKTFNFGANSWTRDQVLNSKLKFTVGTFGGKIIGVTWTVTYRKSGYVYTLTNIQEDHDVILKYRRLMIKNVKSNVLNNYWSPISKAFKKTSSGWTEIDLVPAPQSTLWVNRGYARIIKPDLVKPVQYIEAAPNKTSYINSGINVGSTPTMACDIEFMITENTPNDCALVGWRAGSTSTSSRFYPAHCYSRKFCLGYMDFIQGTTVLPLNKWIFARSILQQGIQEAVVYIDGEVVDSFMTRKTTSFGPGILYIGAVNIQNSPYYSGSTRIRRVRLWKPTNEDVLDISSVIQISSSKAGVFDSVSNQFMASATSNNFIAGPY